jgi:hypothetical protein
MSEVWASTSEHHLSVAPCPPSERRRKCMCGCERKKTHSMLANGICMYIGCEFSAWLLMRNTQKQRGFR